MMHSAFRPSEEIFGIRSVDGGKRHGERQNATGALGGYYENYLVCGLDSLRPAPLRSLFSSGSVDEAVRDVGGPRSGLSMYPPSASTTAASTYYSHCYFTTPLAQHALACQYYIHPSPLSSSAPRRQPAADSAESGVEAHKTPRALRDSLSSLSPTSRSGSLQLVRV